ncbi:hypothetical protein [Blastococcus sp. SYSU D01042]
MSLRRSSLVAAGLAAALVAVPGTAAAAPSDPVDQITAFLDELAAAAPSGAEGAGLPAFTVPPGVRAAFQQLADAAMLPENCVDGVADAIDLVLAGLVALPLELADALAELLELLGGGEGLPLPDELAVLQDLLDQLLGGLAGAAPAAPAAATPGDAAAETAPEEEAPAPATPLDPLLGALPAELPGAPEGTPEEEVPEEEAPVEEAPELPTLVQGLVALGEALQACVPTPPTGGEETPQPTAPVTSPAEPPAPGPAPHTPAPVAQPVTYLGYAPTGADAARADDSSVPLTAVAGGLVLLAGAGAAGYGMRGRARG